MKNNKFVQIVIGLLVASVFLWFAFKEVNFSNVKEQITHMSYGWIIPFIIVTVLSHVFRAWRWKLLVEKEHLKVSVRTLFAAVMSMYAMNYLFPRLGEVTRAVYVSKKKDTEVSTVMGTVVLERVVDTLSLLVLLVVTLFALLAKRDQLIQIVGEGVVDKLEFLYSGTGVIVGLVALVIAIASWFGLSKLMDWFASREIKHEWVNKGRNFILNFWNGIKAIKEVPNWPLFILLTLGIWSCYVLMTYIPFYMFDLTVNYDLSLIDGLILMVVSSLGIVVPSPGGLGTYHYMIQTGLFVLYAVPKSIGLAYSIIVYMVMLLIILSFSPISLLLDRKKD